MVNVYRFHHCSFVRSFVIAGRGHHVQLCIGITRNNSLVDGCARAESNPGHRARHALLHMAAECVNHSATKAGSITAHL